MAGCGKPPWARIVPEIGLGSGRIGSSLAISGAKCRAETPEGERILDIPGCARLHLDRLRLNRRILPLLVLESCRLWTLESELHPFGTEGLIDVMGSDISAETLMAEDHHTLT